MKSKHTKQLQKMLIVVRDSGQILLWKPDSGIHRTLNPKQKPITPVSSSAVKQVFFSQCVAITALAQTLEQTRYLMAGRNSLLFNFFEKIQEGLKNNMGCWWLINHSYGEIHHQDKLMRSTFWQSYPSKTLKKGDANVWFQHPKPNLKYFFCHKT